MELAIHNWMFGESPAKNCIYNLKELNNLNR